MSYTTPVPPDRFLYDRKGPWPQPSPSHPLIEAPEVLNIPAQEQLAWNLTIGARYSETLAGWPPFAAQYAVENLPYTGPTDADFDEMLFHTGYTRFLRPLSRQDEKRFGARVNLETTDTWEKYDFRAMKLVKPLQGMHAAPTRLLIRNAGGTRTAAAILVNGVLVLPTDPAWPTAKIFVLQGAAYHMLFVVHPALHFPMDSVNAVTKTSVPMGHPLFQALYPHTSYSLPLNNAVLESDQSVVNNNAAGTWFDPLTGDAYNLKLLFGAGYAGIKALGNAYPRYDYLKPQMGFDSSYGSALQKYYDVFEAFTLPIAKHIFATNKRDTFVQRWANYLHAHVHGFPHSRKVMGDAEMLARLMAIYMWDVSVSHGADHYSFGTQVPVKDKFLRVRIPPPRTPNDPPPKPGSVAIADDLFRASVAQQMFFLPFAIKPNLSQTLYAFLDPALSASQKSFHANLLAVDKELQANCPVTKSGACCFQPLVPRGDTAEDYAITIPASIQY